MNTPSDNDYPGLCVNAGLTCDSCTTDSARHLETVCKGLRGKLIGQLFVQIYPHAACSRMQRHFAAAYRAASREPPLVGFRGKAKGIPG
jgi:hypothetical protein